MWHTSDCELLCFSSFFDEIGDYAGVQGLGLMRLHSTYRHDLKIYASDEGRVQMTAAAFAKVWKYQYFLMCICHVVLLTFSFY